MGIEKEWLSVKEVAVEYRDDELSYGVSCEAMRGQDELQQAVDLGN